jgi:hypothetical protein
MFPAIQQSYSTYLFEILVRLSILSLSLLAGSQLVAFSSRGFVLLADLKHRAAMSECGPNSTSVSRLNW